MVSRDATTGDVRDRMHLARAQRGEHRRGVDHRRLEQHVAERAVGARPRGVVHPPTGHLEEHAPRERGPPVRVGHLEIVAGHRLVQRQ
jgi:hypothetical protein